MGLPTQDLKEPKISFPILVLVMGGLLVDSFTKQDKSKEINSQGNSGIVNNMNANNVVTNNYNAGITIYVVLNVAKISNKLEMLHLVNNAYTALAKTNPDVYLSDVAGIFNNLGKLYHETTHIQKHKVLTKKL